MSSAVIGPKGQDAHELAALEPRDGRAPRTPTRARRRRAGTDWSRRIDAAMIADITPDLGARSLVCGPTPFVERANDLLVGGGPLDTRPVPPSSSPCPDQLGCL